MNKTDRTRIQKFIHRGLPTNKKLNDRDKEHPATCPSCAEIETNEHILWCQNPKRKTIRKDTANKITKNMKKYDIHVKIQECIVLGTKQWIENQTTTIQKNELSFIPEGDIDKAIDEQNEIGWGNFTRGRMASTWETIQDCRYKTNKSKEKHMEVNQWATSLISTMWEGLLQSWESRNDDQHGRDEATKTTRERTILKQKVRRIYEMLPQLEKEDQRFFTLTEDEWEMKTNKEIQDWLTVAEPLTNEGITRANQHAHNQSLITSFFEVRPREIPDGFSKLYNKRPPRGRQH